MKEPETKAVAPAMSREPVLCVHDVTKVYRLGEIDIHALRKVSLELFAGEFIVLLGASGSRNSTLLNIGGGLETPVSALFRCQSEWCVFALDGKRVRQREVRLGHMNSSEAEILSGLRLNDRVIRHPSNELTDGARVTPII